MRVYPIVLVAVSTLIAYTDVALVAAISSQSTISSSYQVEGTNGRYLKSYTMSGLDENEEERGGVSTGDAVDPKKLDVLLDPEKIEGALANLDDQLSLFSKWLVYEDAILTRLQQRDKIMQYMPILIKFNDLRTSMKYNQVLTDWLNTKILDEIRATLKVHNMKTMREHFTKFYNSGKTADEFTRALNTVDNPIKKKWYEPLGVAYGHFVKRQNALASSPLA